MSIHYSPFHRGPEDHDPPPPYQPPQRQSASAPTSDAWQNEANQIAENTRVAYQHMVNQQCNARQNSMTSSSHSTVSHAGSRQNSLAQAQDMPPPEPQAGPFYGGPPPAGPFYPSNGSSFAPTLPAEPRAYPSLQLQPSSNFQNQSQPPSGPLYPSQPPRGRLYNSDTEGISSYGTTGGTVFNAMPSRVESSSEISTGSGGRCCNIL